ncbi:recombinase family protein [Candidatus Woesearchaeota archaeon]|jgi:site-specific DNA recombinase|nr:recombinase family protein [Candidatus Woesearchaeota archaeon]
MTEKTLQKTNKLIAVYGRVSTSNQESEGTIETQLSAVNEYANKHGYKIVQQYIDNGWSGDSIVRPALDQLRVDAKKKIWEAVLIYDPDRLARRYSYQELVMDELKEASVEIMFVTVSAPKNSEDKILYGVRGLFAEYERAKIAERFRLGKVRKAKEGHIIATEAPYGYDFIKKTSEEQGSYKVNKREVSIVKNIFSWVADEGMTLRKIVKRLQELNIQPRKSKRGVWSTSTLSTLLRNKTYIGEGHYGASYAVIPENPRKKDVYKKIKKTSRRSKPENEWIIIPTPKIIEEDLFKRAQERLSSNSQMSVRNTKNEYLLSHKIWCVCGCRRAGEGPQNGKYLYYRCTDRVKSFPLKSNCSAKGLNARIVDDVIWKKIVTLLSSPELLYKQAERWIDKASSNKATSTVDTTETHLEINNLKEQEARYNKAYGAGVIELDQLKESLFPIKNRIILLKKQIDTAKIEVQSAVGGKLPRKDEVKDFVDNTVSLLKDLNFKSKQEIVRRLVEKVAGNHEKLTITGYIPISNINVFTNNRHCWFAQCRQINTF